MVAASDDAVVEEALICRRRDHRDVLKGLFHLGLLLRIDLAPGVIEVARLLQACFIDADDTVA